MVGEHMQVLRRTEEGTGWRTIGSRLEMVETERPGEVGRSIANRTEGTDREDPTMLTRLGETERGKLEGNRAEKDEEEVAKEDSVSDEDNTEE